MKILLVEDSSEKASAIRRVILSVPQIGHEDVIVVADVVGAKRELMTQQFDALVLDIQVPLRFGDSAKVDGGARLLDELGASKVLKKPPHIVGVTQFEDSFVAASRAFSSSLAGLIQYSLVNSGWEAELRGFLNQAQLAVSAELNAHAGRPVDLVIVCALNNPELQAVLKCLPELASVEDIDGCTISYSGTFQTDRGKRKIVAACALEMGMAASAALSAKLISLYKPRYIAMCGISGGVKNEVQLGDVIVADVVWDYSAGKLYTENGQPLFKPEPKVISLDAFTKRQMILFMNDHQVIKKIQAGWSEKLPAEELGVHLGPLFTGALVVANKAKVDELTFTHRKLKGIEMEAYGVFCSAKYSDHPQPIAIAIKSISDFADEQKDDIWRRYASYTSASYLLEWARRYL